MSSFKSFLKFLGPGLITGASDDDPASIGTFSQAGAKFGFGLLWTVLFTLPLMLVVQEMSARLGLLKGNGLAAIMKKKYSKKVVLPIVFLLLIANIINIGADIRIMSDSAKIIIPSSFSLFSSSSTYSLIFTFSIITAILLIPYKRYVGILKYLTISLLAYIATAVIVGGNWYQILSSTLVPHIELSTDFIIMLVALFGTAISPYLFFWQASEEVEEEISMNKIKDIGKGKPSVSDKEIKTMRKDVISGMGFAQFITWTIVITCSGSLHDHGITDIQSAEQAAKSLEPIVKTFPDAGIISKTIFAAGIIGTGLLSVPILASSAAYALSDTFEWKEGLSKNFGQAKAFYFVIAFCGIIGLIIPLLGINPIKALVYTSVINGVVSVPVIFVIMRLANDKKILQERTNGPLLNIMGWLTFGIMATLTIIMFITIGKQF